MTLPRKSGPSKPLQIEQLAQADRWLEVAIVAAGSKNDRRAELRHLRNRVLLLPGFWRGYRGDELTRLRAEHVEVVPGQGMSCYFALTETDRQV